MTPNEAFPVLRLYYNQAQSSQDPKRGISSTKVALQPKLRESGAEGAVSRRKNFG